MRVHHLSAQSLTGDHAVRHLLFTCSRWWKCGEGVQSSPGIWMEGSIALMIIDASLCFNHGGSLVPWVTEEKYIVHEIESPVKAIESPVKACLQPF